MRTSRFSVLLAATAGLVLATAGAATADPPQFAPYVSTAIPNGPGPGPAPRGTVSADFTGDGRADIVTISNFTQGNLLLAPGRGDGTFATTSQIPGTSQVQGIDTGDLDGDGRADVVAMTTSQVLIELGNGHGGFTLGGSYPLTLGGQVEPRVMDVTGDGKPDIVAPTFTAIQSLVNNGNGTFHAGPTTQLPGTGAISAISPATLDGDGRADLLAVDGFSATGFALRGTGTGAFTVSGQLYLTGLVPEDVAAIDLNGDGYDDLATIGSFSFTLATALTDGAGRFTTTTAAVTQFSGPGPTSLTAADLNRDGRADLAVSSLATPAPAIKVLAGDGTMSMHVQGDYPVGVLPQNPVVADFTGDGKPDIVTAGPGSLSTLRNIGA
ncbi:MAG: hypothetical protein QOI15_1746 [Pseudonocardiales bacterium]|jgi:hypothetical protein|nr:hypothetical protein [Pseudonocardiales bacterium]